MDPNIMPVIIYLANVVADFIASFGLVRKIVKGSPAWIFFMIFTVAVVSFSVAWPIKLYTNLEKPLVAIIYTTDFLVYVLGMIIGLLGSDKRY